MAKKKEEFNPFAGTEITVVARKKGKPDKYKNMIYEDAVIAKAKFKKNGWETTFYQVGFYTPQKE